jgi:sugar-specific transcriptional regulator TrmB
MNQDLKQLGLSHYESKALETALKESLTARALAKKAQIPLGKVYSIINSLEKKNLINQTESRPKLVYVENASAVISRLIEQKQRQDEQLISTIRELATEIDVSKSKPSKFFQIGTDTNDNKEIQLRSFIEAQKEVLQIINIHHKPKSNRENKTLWEKEIVKAIDRGVIFKAIYPKSTILPHVLQKLNPKLFQVRRHDTDFARCDIVDEKKVLIKLVNEDPLQFGGVIFVENEKLAKNLTKIFNELWEQAE